MKIVQVGSPAGNFGHVERTLLTSFTRMQALKAYFFHKWINHPERVDTLLRKELEKVTPVTAEFVPSLECPFSCPACTYREWKELTAAERGHRLMNEELMDLLIDRLKEGGLKALIFTGGGEPLTNPHTLKKMLYAKRAGLDVGLFTNGFHLDEAKIRYLLTEVAPNFIRVSLNAASGPVHQLFHGLNSTEPFTRVIKNIFTLARIKHQEHSLTSIGIGILVGPENIDDLTGLSNVPALKQVSDLFPHSINYIAFRPTVVYGGQEKEQLPANIFERSQRVINGDIHPALDARGFRVINIRERFQDINAARGYEFCRAHPWRLSVAYDGGVYACAENNGRPEFYFGNLADKDETLEHIWKGERRMKVIENLNNGMMKALCPPICVLTYMNQMFESFAQNLREEDVPELEQYLSRLRAGATPVDVNFL